MPHPAPESHGRARNQVPHPRFGRVPLIAKGAHLHCVGHRAPVQVTSTALLSRTSSSRCCLSRANARRPVNEHEQADTPAAVFRVGVGKRRCALRERTRDPRPAGASAAVGAVPGIDCASNVASRGGTPDPGTAIQAAPGSGVDAVRCGVARSDTVLHRSSRARARATAESAGPRAWRSAGNCAVRGSVPTPRRALAGTTRPEGPYEAPSATPNCYSAHPVDSTPRA